MATEHWIDHISSVIARKSPRRGLLGWASALTGGLVIASADRLAAGKKKGNSGRGKGKPKPKGKKPNKPNKPNPPTGADPCRGLCGDHLTCCNARCVFLQMDRDNCGACGNACLGAATCVNGDCVCDSGFPGSRFKECPGEGCVDTDTSPFHCGDCNKPCSEWEVCNFGRCECAGSLTRCGNDCVDTDGDRDHCGDCNNACRADERCIEGGCAPDSSTCEPGKKLCQSRDWPHPRCVPQLSLCCPGGFVCGAPVGVCCVSSAGVPYCGNKFWDKPCPV